ncbi:MAG TPA: TIGR03621 family F420-dependent LLM class oxidoreductase [Mycobacteriales bacterium]|nr:TIGR03621 family F420-dependent LLM class oxidoreductase [Mycobacteriales bacterium]
MRPFRFLTAAPFGAPDAGELTAAARRAEAAGFDAMVLPDHLLAQHAPVPLLATVAAATERLRVGTFVLNVDLRHPAVLAQDLASLDVLSGGRLEIGIGAGWNRPEYDAIGVPYDPVPVRVARLAEAVAVLKGCFGDGPFSFAGEHYTVTDHEGHPKPVQRPHPPIMIGGGGRRTLTLAGREADVVGLAPRPGDPRSYTLAATAEKIGWVREAAGDRFADLELNVYPSGGSVVVTDDARGAARERVDRFRAQGGELTVEDVLDSPHVFIGSVPALTEKILGLRERFGISSVMLDDVEATAPIVAALAGT